MRIGIVGAGDMGSTHAKAYRSMSGVEIAGVAGRSPERAARLAGELGVPALTDPMVLIEDISVDAIDLTFPSGLHRDWAVASLGAGKHVFCETPMALTLEDADAMIDAARQHDRILLVAQLMRFVPEWALVHAEVTSGALGRPIAASIARRTAPYGVGQKRSVALYGEPIVELMIFDFDYLNWLFGMPDAIYAGGIVGPSGVIEHASAMLDFGTVHGMVEGSAMMPASFPFTTNLRVVCEGGALESYIRLSDEPAFNLVRYPKTGKPEEVQVEDGDPYEAECLHFVRCVSGETGENPLDAASARDALRVALAAAESASASRPVHLR